MSFNHPHVRPGVLAPLLLIVAAVLATGCATPFRAHSEESLLFPDVIRSPTSVRPTVSAEPDRPIDDVAPADRLSSDRISIRESPSDARRSIQWEQEVRTYTARVLSQELAGAFANLDDNTPKTDVEFEFAGQARTISGAAGGASDVIVRLTTTLPSGEEVVSFPQRGAFFSEGDMSLMQWTTIPVSVGLGLVVSALLFPEVPPLAVGFLVSGGALSLFSLGAAAVAEQWVIRKSEQRWSAVYREALVTHANDIRAALVAQRFDMNDPAAGGRFDDEEPSNLEPPRPEMLPPEIEHPFELGHEAATHSSPSL